MNIVPITEITHWESVAIALADSAYDTREAHASHDDAAWDGFDNLRSMFEDAGGVPDVVAWDAERAYRERARVLFGRDWFAVA